MRSAGLQPSLALSRIAARLPQTQSAQAVLLCLPMSAEDHKQALPPGFRLGAYHIVRVLGVGGFGVTYLCEHTGLAVQVAVKEYLPNEIAVRDGTEVHPKSDDDREGFEWGLSRFLDEARTLARFEHPNVVRVRDCFEANNTAYIVMDYEEGEPLDRLLQRLGTLTEGQLKRVLLPVVDGLRQVHAAGFLHRDIKPANIFVRRSDESPVLLDFGSARQALGRRSRSVTAIASAGFAAGAVRERRAPGRVDGHLRSFGAVLPRHRGRRADGGAAAPKPAAANADGSAAEVGECGRRGLFAGVSGSGGSGLASDRDGASAEPRRVAAEVGESRHPAIAGLGEAGRANREAGRVDESQPAPFAYDCPFERPSLIGGNAAIGRYGWHGVCQGHRRVDGRLANGGLFASALACVVGRNSVLAKTESLPASRRRRRRGRRRTVAVANSVLWLRCARLGRWFDEYWDDRTARLAA